MLNNFQNTISAAACKELLECGVLGTYSHILFLTPCLQNSQRSVDDLCYVF